MIKKQDNSVPANKKSITPKTKVANKAKLVRTGKQGEETKKLATGFEHLGDLFSRFELQDSGGYISQEFQDYGYRLAVELDDLKHKSLYIKLAKTEQRGVLEQARSFVSDAAKARSKARLFMWKIKQIKQEKKKVTNSEIKK
jgi:hypothetical protein